MIKGLLGKNKNKFITVSQINLDENIESKPNIPNGMWSKCSSCNNIIYTEDLEKNLYVCPNCGFHFRIDSRRRIESMIDENTFEEFNKNLRGNDPLKFSGYTDKLNKISQVTKINEAVTTGYAKINGKKIVLCIMDSTVLMGSMGSAVGEKITRAIEIATNESLPIVIFTASGGARMQEGIFSLMQMAKISAALNKHSEAKGLYITVLTDPTTGGVTASFAMQGDIILSEPNCTIGFAGRRVVEKTLNTTLPDNFQTAEFLLEKGFIDKIVKRKDMKNMLYRILSIHEVK